MPPSTMTVNSSSSPPPACETHTSLLFSVF
jgi:hypothetical protein